MLVQHTFRRLWGRMSWRQALGGFLVLFLVLAPVIWMFMVSIIPERDLFLHKVIYIPPSVTLDNYVDIVKLLNFNRAFVNSVVVAILTTAWTLPLSIPAAYAFARLRFPGRTALIVSLLLIYMLPGILMLIPLLVILRSVGLLNTYAGLILAESTHTIPFAIWLLTNYIATLPRDLEDAARIDGCSRVGAMLRVTLPLAVPGIITAALFSFIASWNNFTFAFMFTSGDKVRTMPVVLRQLNRGEAGIKWGTQMAGSVMAALPVAVVYLFFQKYLVRGLAAGGIKG